jgi:hypothetical protein
MPLNRALRRSRARPARSLVRDSKDLLADLIGLRLADELVDRRPSGFVQFFSDFVHFGSPVIEVEISIYHVQKR